MLAGILLEWSHPGRCSVAVAVVHHVIAGGLVMIIIPNWRLIEVMIPSCAAMATVSGLIVIRLFKMEGSAQCKRILQEFFLVLSADVVIGASVNAVFLDLIFGFSSACVIILCGNGRPADIVSLKTLEGILTLHLGSRDVIRIKSGIVIRIKSRN